MTATRTTTLYDVNLKTNTVRDLTPHPGVRAQMVDVDPKHPQEILVGLNLNDRSKFDVHRINLTTGAMELDTKNPGNVVTWTADADFKIRAAIAATKDGGYDLLYRAKPKAKWRVLRHWDSEDQGSPVGFSEDGKTLYLIANHDCQRAAARCPGPGFQEGNGPGRGSDYDVSGALVHPDEAHHPGRLLQQGQGRSQGHRR